MTDDDYWRSAPLGYLVDHIVATHHAYLNRQLPLIAQLLTAHARRYWLAHPEILTAHTTFAQIQAALTQHLLREETTAVPLIHAHEADPSVSLAPFVDNIPDHVAEHAAARRAFAALRATLWDYVAPADVGAEVGFTLGQLAELETDLAQHIHLEDDILFERARSGH